MAAAETHSEEEAVELVAHAAAETDLKIRHRIRSERKPCRESVIIERVGGSYRFVRRFKYRFVGISVARTPTLGCARRRSILLG